MAVTKVDLEAMRAGLGQSAALSSGNHLPDGSLHYRRYWTAIPHANLPPLEADAMIFSGCFSCSGNGVTCILQAASTNRTNVRSTASPSGAYSR